MGSSPLRGRRVLTESIETLQRALANQGAPTSHLERIKSLRALFESDPNCIAAALVGSYAQGTGDRISDLDLVAFTATGSAPEFIERAHGLLACTDLLDHYCGSYAERGCFRKYVFLDFASCELHAFNVPTSFKLRRPYIPVWDPSGFLERVVADGPPPRHEEFEAYQHGDEGLIWELFDCIKWLKRGRVELTKGYLHKLVEKLQ